MSFIADYLKVKDMSDEQIAAAKLPMHGEHYVADYSHDFNVYRVRSKNGHEEQIFDTAKEAISALKRIDKPVHREVWPMGE
jgi:hypothetical protein